MDITNDIVTLAATIVKERKGDLFFTTLFGEHEYALLQAYGCGIQNYKIVCISHHSDTEKLIIRGLLENLLNMESTIGFVEETKINLLCYAAFARYAEFEHHTWYKILEFLIDIDKEHKSELIRDALKYKMLRFIEENITEFDNTENYLAITEWLAN